MPTEQSLIPEIESTLASGSAEKRAEILRRVTNLFMLGAHDFSHEQIDLFDQVIARLAERIETRVRADLADRLAPVDNAPPATMRALASDESIEVAAPVLTQSQRLTDADLVAIATSQGQDRLLAISKRATLSENVSDVLVTRGDREVVRSVAQNEGARFSDAGFGKLVDRSIEDEVLAICVGMRQDIPRKHFQTLISQASERVFKKLAAKNPAAGFQVRRVLSGITGQDVIVKPATKRDYRAAETKFRTIRRSGAPVDPLVEEFARAARFEETVVALAMLCRVPIEAVEKVMEDRNGDNDLTLLLAKAAGLSWPTAKQICLLRLGEGGLSRAAAETARQNFENLQPSTAQRVVRFYHVRQAGAAGG